MKPLEPGQLLETEIVSISGGCVFLQLSGKSEGQIDAEELTDKDGNMTVEVGDTIKAYFHSAKNGDLLFTTRIHGEKAGSAILETAFLNKIPIEGVVEKEIKGGYQITVGDTRAFCPYSQITLNRADSPEDFIGTKQTFRITEYKENGRNLLVSRRVILEEERNATIEELKKTLKEHMTITGTVRSLQDFGAFVDISVLRALLPISEISRERITDLHKVLSVGQEIEASIIKLDWKNERITLSMKALLADPWDSITTDYSVGSTYEGTVARLTNFGAFVTLEPGLDGLIHISDLPGESRDTDGGKPVKQGQTIQVQITNIDAERRRMSLKPVSSVQVDKAFTQYMEPESDTYNPFAELLKDRTDKKKK
ncbi:MAG: S1 RNA-binding domain-containing protein [Spirochaetia bacterium]|nr:S1 RNA-binding domain-containing protein [Spirochaetia bacterium]MCF7940055.1 S1 RNA-binding domain-containing protein [Spirochaetia bacterium]